MVNPPEQTFSPPAALAASANVRTDAYAVAAADPEEFWAEQARRLQWTRAPEQAYDGTAFHSSPGSPTAR